MRTPQVLWTVMASLLVAGVAVSERTETTLGTVHLGQAVLADGKPLPAGTYHVQLTNDTPQPGVGQSSTGERWVAFLRDGRLAGREVATIVAATEIDTVAKGPRPKPNHARVDVLKGGEYVRVWISREKVNDIINMPPAR